MSWATNSVFTVTVPVVCQELKIGTLNLFQALILKIKSNPELRICKWQRKLARRLLLLRGVTPDFGNQAIHEHLLKSPFKFVHRRLQTYGDFNHFFGSCADKKVMISSNFTRLLDHCPLPSKKERLLFVQDGTLR